MKLAKLLLLTLLISGTSRAQEMIRLYPGRAPGSEKWNWTEKETTSHEPYNVTDPTLTVYLPPRAIANGTGVVVCPGGGFGTLVMESEGIQAARWLNSQGITAFLLKYRLERTYSAEPGKETRVKLNDMAAFSTEVDSVVQLAVADGKAAIAYVRKHSRAYGLSPEKIGIMGFSAGGTVACGTGLTGTGKSRPDFVIPVYAYVNGLRDANAKSGVPPIFICTAADDRLIDPLQSIGLYESWLRAGSPAELHLYAQGGHGFGLGKTGTTTANWLNNLEDWLLTQNLIKR